MCAQATSHHPSIDPARQRLPYETDVSHNSSVNELLFMRSMHILNVFLVQWPFLLDDLQLISCNTQLDACEGISCPCDRFPRWMRLTPLQAALAHSQSAPPALPSQLRHTTHGVHSNGPATFRQVPSP